MYQLTGTTASSTYTRLVQIIDNLYYDGLGNLLNLGGGTYAIGPQGSVGATGPQGSGQTGSTGATGPQGSAGTSFTYEGTWDDMVAYFPSEVVTYNGESFLNLLPSSTSGSPPYPTPDTSPTIWGIIAAKGATGTPGLTGPQGEKGSTGSGAYFIQPGPPAPTASNVGDRWYDLTTGQEFVWINDGDSSQWVVPNISTSGPQGPAGSGATLSSTQIGFGDSSNQITSSGNLTFDDTNKNLVLGTYRFTTGGNHYSGLAFGKCNRMYASYQSSIIGGDNNILGEYYSSSITNNSSIIGGSHNNLKFYSSNTILGGDCNYMTNSYKSSIIGGYKNNINLNGYNSSVIIGSGNSYINGNKGYNTNYNSIISSNNSGIYNSYNSSIIGGSHLYLSGNCNVVLMPSIMTAQTKVGDYSPASGFKWKLGGYNRTVVCSTGYIEVTINGVIYKLLATN